MTTDHSGPFSLRLLLAEDDPIGRELMKKIAIRLGHQVDVVNHGLQALALAAANSYDLILLDVSMPVMDGYACAREIRRGGGVNSGTVLVAVTGHVHENDRRQAFEAGMTDHLPKPVRIDEMKALILRHFG